KGKTTVFNLLLGFLSPQRGQIFINNTKADEKDLKKYWPNIAYVRRQGFFIHDSVLRNITLEETSYNKDTLKYAIQLSGLDELLNNSEEGISKIITENGKNISGGQQQRIAL